MLYVIGTKELGLKLGSDEGVKLYATVDASYACHEDSKSHSGCTLHVGRDSGSIMTISKKQKLVADSSTCAEFIATHLIAKEIMWGRNFLKSIGHPQEEPTTLFEDNTSTIAMIKNKSNGKKTKHIEVRYNLIREQVEKLVIKMQHLSSKDAGFSINLVRIYFHLVLVIPASLDVLATHTGGLCLLTFCYLNLV